MLEIKGTIIKASTRTYKDKTGKDREANDINIILANGEFLKLGYNNIHESFDIELAKNSIREEATFNVDIVPNEFNHNNPIVVFHDFSVGN